MKPLLAHTYDGEHRIIYPVFVQPKFNGIRALYQNGMFQSRDELPWHPTVLVHISDALKRIFPPEVVLDGELYRHGWPLQRINGAVQIARTAPSVDTLEILYMIFDMVDFSLPFHERIGYVTDRLLGRITVPMAVATTIQVDSEKQVNSFYSMLVNEGFEGIMYRLGDCPYTVPKQPKPEGAWNRRPFLSDKNNRVWHMLKRKSFQDDEYPCVGIQEGLGKRAGAVGAFVCLTLEGRRFHVGSGLTDAEASHYFQHPEEVLGHKIKVKFLTLTSENKPFNPTIEQIL